MRKALLTLPFLLAGCVNDSASYYINGNDNTLTLRVAQEKFWEKRLTVRLLASNMPACQRQLVLGTFPRKGMRIELAAIGDSLYTLSNGEQVWQVDAERCETSELAQAVPGRQLGMFKFTRRQFVFETTGTSPSVNAEQ